MKLYLAGPLFTKAEQQFNRDVRDALVAAGHTVFLPQEEAANYVGMMEGWERMVFNCNRWGIDDCEMVVAIMDGAQVDDGTAWECGYAYWSNKPVIGLRTDFRDCGDGSSPVNLMLYESAETILCTIDDVIKELS